MALIHDMGEALIGDITPSDGVSKGSLTYALEYTRFLTCFRTEIRARRNGIEVSRMYGPLLESKLRGLDT
jgi:hypothetical protein